MSKDIYQSIDETEEILCEEYHPHESSIQAAIQEMPSDDELFDLAETFKIFGDSTRIRIICALLPGEMCVWGSPNQPSATSCGCCGPAVW